MVPSRSLRLMVPTSAVVASLTAKLGALLREKLSLTLVMSTVKLCSADEPSAEVALTVREMSLSLSVS